MPSKKVSVDVFVDVVCPWCFIGERRLIEAIKRRPELDVTVRYRSYLLMPGMPAEGMPAKTFFVEKFGPMERIRQMWSRVAEAGRPDGIEFEFEKQERAPSSLLAHRILKVVSASQSALADRTLEALFSAHFEQALDIGNESVVLAQLGKAIPELSLQPLGEALADGGGTAEVERDFLLGRRVGVQGVPFYVGNGKVAVSGAGEVDYLASFLDRSAEEEPLPLDRALEGQAG